MLLPRHFFEEFLRHCAPYFRHIFSRLWFQSHDEAECLKLISNLSGTLPVYSSILLLSKGPIFAHPFIVALSRFFFAFAFMLVEGVPEL